MEFVYRVLNVIVTSTHSPSHEPRLWVMVLLVLAIMGTSLIVAGLL